MERIIGKIKRILSGYYLILIGFSSFKSRKRLLICSKCELRTGIICGDCGCLLIAKTKVNDESCPVKKW